MKDDTGARIRKLRKVKLLLALRARQLEADNERKAQRIADLKRKIEQLEDEIKRCGRHELRTKGATG
jgi:hypothetical protein